MNSHLLRLGRLARVCLLLFLSAMSGGCFATLSQVTIQADDPEADLFVNWKFAGKGSALYQIDKLRDYVIVVRKDDRAAIGYLGSRLRGSSLPGLAVATVSPLPFKESGQVGEGASESGQTVITLHVPGPDEPLPTCICAGPGVVMLRTDDKKLDDPNQPSILTPGTHTCQITFAYGTTYTPGSLEVTFAALPGRIYIVQAERSSVPSHVGFRVHDWLNSTCPPQRWYNVGQ